MMNIPERLIEEIKSGRVILFLGAGATIGARTDNGTGVPLGKELGSILSNEFLGGKFKDKPLDWIAELAKSESDLITIQDYVCNLFQPLKPSSFHQLIPEFKWRGIATTNYDDIIEKSYSMNSDKVQDLVPFISDKDRIDERLKTERDLPYIKLHGCITRTHDKAIPLTLSHDQYTIAEEGRRRLFDMVYGWGHEHTFLFVGHELYDSDIRQFLESLIKMGEFRPRYYLIKPNVSEIEKRLWESKRISVLSGTFEEFMKKLGNEIPKNIRPLFKIIQNYEHPIQTRFKRNHEISPSLNEFLSSEVQYIHNGMKIPEGDPKAFYKGYSQEWFPIDKKLDVRRKLTDTLLFEIILATEDEKPSNVEFYLVKAEAGAGKSILLRRLAWEAALEAKCLSLFANEQVNISYDSIFEIYNECEERIYLFIDNVGENIETIIDLLNRAKSDGIKLTIISAERINIWNVHCAEQLDEYITESYPLRYLSQDEIKILLDKLDEHNSLGRLVSMSRKDQIREFERGAGRQLLVALHEVTLGKPFEEIIEDEFRKVRPQIAQSIYLSICVLNRMKIPVRAGLIARVHKIPFKKFQERLFGPLEHVVKVTQDKIIGDYMYSARHPEIAEMVFEQVLSSPEDKYSEYMKLLHEMNTLYSSDNQSFIGLIKAKSILEFFPDYQMAIDIYDIAEKVSPNDKKVYQQRSIYEMKRDQPNFKKAQELLEKARELDKKDPTIIHSLSELYRIKADMAENEVEKDKFREKCKEFALSLKQSKTNAKYSRHTLIKMHQSRLRELINSDNISSAEIDKEVKRIEEYLEEGLQESPGDPYLKIAESELNEILKENLLALESLKSAFNTNKRDSFIAIRLAKAYIKNNQPEEAEKVLETALEANRNDRKIHYNYAMIKKELGSTDTATLIYHYRRGFTKWDKNYEAQFWYARYCFESDEDSKKEEADEIFEKLREAWIPYEIRVEVRDKIKQNGNPKVFIGAFGKVERTFGFVSVEGSGREIFVHKNEADHIWENLKANVRVKFEIGFTLRGPVAVNIELYS